MKLRVDHFSIAVRSIESTLEFFSRYLPVEMNHATSDGYDGEFRWCDFYMGHIKVELIESARPGGFVDRFLEKRGQGIHHISFEVDDLDAMIGPMERDGLRIVDRFEASETEKTAFVSPRSAFGMLVQFWQVDHDPTAVPKRERIAPLPFGDGRMHFDHIALAVRNIDPAMEFFHRYFPIEPHRGRHVGYAGDFEIEQFSINDYRMEVVADLSGSSFAKHFVDKRGEGFHHISIDVDELDPIVEKLRSDGLRVVDEADIGNGYKTAFISPKSAHGVLIQFWQVPDLDSPE